jgi:CubicO group peptidase (beta-lactamase class C family)
MAERLFEPLGMADTGFSVPAGKVIRHLDVRKGAYERAQRCILNLVRV